MKTRAAVARAAGKPLAIEEVDLEGPRAGEVLVEIEATGVCHTDAYTLSGADPEGMLPVDPRARGRRRRGRGGAGRRVGRARRPRDPALHARVPQCKSCLSGKTNLCQAIRATQGQGLMPDGTSRFSLRGRSCATTWAPRPSRTTRCCPRSRGEDPQGRPVREGLPTRLRRHDRDRRGALHREGGARARASWCSGSAASGSR